MGSALKCFLVGLLFASGYVHANTEAINYSIYRGYYSPRALGMGDAFVALADDYNTLYYNPAGLARLKEGEINLKIQAGISPQMITLGNDIKALDSGNKSESQKVSDAFDLLDKYYGSHHWLGFPNIGATWVRPGWGVSFLPVQSNIDVDINRSAGGPSMAVEAYVDSVLAYGYGKSFGEYFSAGATLKGVHRGYVGKVLPAAEIIGNSNFYSEKDFKEGFTVDVDLGALYTVPIPSSGFFSFFKYAKPTFGFVGRNLIDYGFKTNFHLLNKNSTEAPKLGRRFDVGSNWELPSFWVFQPRFLLDVRDIGHEFFTLRKGLHTGVELAWNAFSWLKGGYRMGLNQGYFTAGISAQLAWFALDLATWGEEVGTTNAAKENRRYIVQMSMDF